MLQVLRNGSVPGTLWNRVIATEAAFWYSDGTFENADSAILNAVRATLATTGGPLIVIASPYGRPGEIWEI